MTDDTDTPRPLFPPGSPRQDRVTELVEQGHTLATAVGVAASEELGYTPLPQHGVDDPGVAPPRDPA